MSTTIDRAFFRRRAVHVAPDLLGKELRHGRCSILISEVEAYSEDDEASHSHRGPTARNAVMFGPPGLLYVYLCYGIHWCVNIVTGEPGSGEAVLIRAGRVCEGAEIMRERRPTARRSEDVANGPGKLTAALGINRSHNGCDLFDEGSVVSLGPGVLVPAETVQISTRIGITKATEMPWRFSVPVASLSRPVS